MTSTKERIIEKLDGLVHNIERLDIEAELPASEMTFEEYDDRYGNLFDTCAESIEGICKAEARHAETERTCNVIGCGYHQSDEIKVWWYALSCGHRIYLMEGYGDSMEGYYGDTYPYGKFCPNCGARITHKEDA